MTNLIIDLPRSLSSAILADFLATEDVGRLDSAFCREKLRESFLELLSCAEYKTKDNLMQQCYYFGNFRWYVARSVKIRCLYLTEELRYVGEPAIVQFLNVTGRHIEKLVVFSLNIDQWIHNPQIQFDCLLSLEMTHTVWGKEELATILRRSPKLRKLIISSNSKFDRQYFQDIWIPNLLSVTLIGTFGECDMTFLAEIGPNVTSLEMNVPRFDNSHNPSGVVVAYKALQSLVLDKIEDAALICIADGCPLLRHIYICVASALTDASVSYLCNKCSKLESVKLDFCVKLTSVSLQAMGNKLHATLRELKLNGCDAINSCAGLQSCRSLEKLTLSTSIQAFISDLYQLFASCTAVCAVDISGMLIDHDTLISLAHNCPQLDDLRLAYCTGCTPAGLLELAVHARQLKRLTIPCTGELSEEARKLLIANGCEIYGFACSTFF